MPDFFTRVNHTANTYAADRLTLQSSDETIITDKSTYEFVFTGFSWMVRLVETPDMTFRNDEISDSSGFMITDYCQGWTMDEAFITLEDEDTATDFRLWETERM